MHDYKTFAFEVKDVSEQGVFEGYASTFGNVDRQNDKVVQGAFKRTLRQHNGKVPILWQHRDPIGVGLEAKEDAQGLYVKGQLVMSVKQAQEARDLTAAGAIKSMSIGYSIPKGGWDTEESGTRLLKDLDLIEYSLVTFPANPNARVSLIKSTEDFTDRELEDFLRDVGFSQKDAKTIVSRRRSTQKTQRDVGDSDVETALAEIRETVRLHSVAADLKSHIENILRG